VYNKQKRKQTHKLIPIFQTQSPPTPEGRFWSSGRQQLWNINTNLSGVMAKKLPPCGNLMQRVGSACVRPDRSDYTKEGRSCPTTLESTKDLFLPQFSHGSLSNQILSHLKLRADLRNETYLNPRIPVLAIA